MLGAGRQGIWVSFDSAWVLAAVFQIHKKFDLKGSTDGRTTGPKVDPNDPKSIFKDLDLDLQVGRQVAA